MLPARQSPDEHDAYGSAAHIGADGQYIPMAESPAYEDRREAENSGSEEPTFHDSAYSVHQCPSAYSHGLRDRILAFNFFER